MTATTHGIYLVYGECNAYAPNLKPIAQRLVNGFLAAAERLGATLAEICINDRHVNLVVIGDERISDMVDEFDALEFDGVIADYVGPDHPLTRAYVGL